MARETPRTPRLFAARLSDFAPPIYPRVMEDVMVVELGPVSTKTKGTIFFFWQENGLFPLLTFPA